MKVLLDTNIIIHREANKVVKGSIGDLFYWLDKMKYEKWVHPVTLKELKKYSDKKAVETIDMKLKSYNHIKTHAPIQEPVKEIIENYDQNENDKNDSSLLNELYDGRVDMLISEDKGIHKKAEKLGIEAKVWKIDQFIEFAIAQNPGLIDYQTLSVKKQYFGDLDLNDSFFDSFKEDYEGFEKWFKKKSNEEAYVLRYQGEIRAFLYLKIEDQDENYVDIKPPFHPRKRLKIGTFKVNLNGLRIGERLLKIAFDNAIKNKVAEIYVTIFEKRIEQKQLIQLFEEFGFFRYGYKGNELVLVRNLDKENADPNNPKKTFPFFSREKRRAFIVPIYPEYHTELFPDSILKTESPMSFEEVVPHRNAISKSYISHSRERGLQSGDVIVFYRTGESKPKVYSSVVSTIGIVEKVHDNIGTFEELVEICRKRTVLTDEELKQFWNRYPGNRPFVVNFLYAWSFPKRPRLKDLLDQKVISDIKSVPRGFEEIGWLNFYKIAGMAYKK